MNLRHRRQEEFFSTPPGISDLIVKLVDPKVGETVYDPACGTGNLLIAAYDHMVKKLGSPPDENGLEILRSSSLYGREIDQEVYALGLAKLRKRGIRIPNIWNGNTLLSDTYDDSFPREFDVILLDPPFGAKVTPKVQKRFDFPSRNPESLFLQHVIDSLKMGGRCAAIVSESLLFRTETAYTQTKRKLLDECEVHRIYRFFNQSYSLAYTKLQTSLIIFTKGKPTQSTEFVDLASFSAPWTVSRRTIEAQNYQLAQENPSPARPLLQRPTTISDALKYRLAFPERNEHVDYMLQELTNNDVDRSSTITPGTKDYQIFISYRRSDSAWPVALLHTSLRHELGEVKVFKDTDSIVLFEDFSKKIKNALDSCDVLIAVIGKRWVGKTRHQRRIDDPKDFVRLEVATALKREIWVYPILLDDARMPSEDELPGDIAPITKINALKMTAETFDEGIAKLIKKLVAVIGVKQE